MKYMLAMQCSNPKATKPLMGQMMARILPVVLRAELQSQTAKQTRVLQRIPRTNASVQSRSHLAAAMFSAFKATPLSARAHVPDQ